MAGDDPFAEPGDSERTVIRPNPGGRRAAAAPARPTANPFGQPSATQAGQGGGEAFGVPTGTPQAPRQADAGPIAMTGLNPLNACAAPLFALVSRIRNRAQHVDPDKLRQSVVSEIRAFENRALQAGIDAQVVKVARYALCATIDDVVLNTPWGGQSGWAMQSMVGTFHRETVGGDRFFDLLARLEKEPAANIDLLEFIYLCLSMGFEGRLRIEDRGGEKHLAIRGALARIIRGQRGAVERDLSVHWKGLDKPHRPLSAWRPVWIAVAVSAALMATTFGSLSWALGRKSENLVGQITALDAGLAPVLERRAPPPPPPPPPPPEVNKVAQVQTFLEPEIKEGIVEVFEKGNTLVVRLAGAGMFASGSDKLDAKFEAPIRRVTEALKDEAGTVIVAGYSDNIPLSGRGRFKDNAALSLARATSVKNLMAGIAADPARFFAEGRGEKDPIADNATPDGRAKNRRIEIILVRTEEG